MTVTRARGGSLEQEFAFGAARQLLEPLVVAGDPAQVFSGAAAAAAPVLGHGVANAASDPGSVLHGLYWVTANAAESRPLALICDDAHWFDSPSLRFLAYLARRVDELPIAVIVGTRPPTSTGPEADLLGRLLTDPAGRHVRPSPLSDDGVAQLVRSTLDAPPDPSFCQAVAEASRGNPFLVGELIRAAARSGITDGRGSGTTLAELSAGTAVLNRIGRLPEAALELAARRRGPRQQRVRRRAVAPGRGARGGRHRRGRGGCRCVAARRDPRAGTATRVRAPARAVRRLRRPAPGRSVPAAPSGRRAAAIRGRARPSRSPST